MSKDSQHLQSTCVKGKWWLAEHPERVLLGEITYGTCSGAEVHLFGSFYELNDQSFLEKGRPTILGVTVKGERITLFNCMMSGATYHIGGGGGATSAIQSYFGVVGAHYQNADDVCVSRIEVVFNGLFEWTATSGIRIIPEEGGKFQLSYQNPGILSLGAFRVGNGSLEFTAVLDPNLGRCHIDENCVFVLECDKPVDYSKVEDDVQTFQLLLALATQRPAYALKVTGRNQPDEDDKDLIFIRKLSILEKDLKSIHLQEMLFCFGDIRRDIQNFIRNLVDKRDQLRPCFDLYFSTIYANSHSPRVDVLLLAQALEGIHRITVGGRYVDNQVYEDSILPALLSALPSGLDSSFRASLKAKMKF